MTTVSKRHSIREKESMSSTGGEIRLSRKDKNILVALRDRGENPVPSSTADRLVARGLLSKTKYTDEPTEYRITARGRAAIEPTQPA